MAPTSGILVVIGLPTPTPTEGVPPLGFAWAFPVTNGNLVTTAAAFSQQLKLPTGVTAQVYDSTGAQTFTLSGTWS
jgi:hypothetical protein